MKSARFLNHPLVYRTLQVWQVLHARSEDIDQAQVRGILNSQQMAIFTRMLLSEQAHSLHVYQKLRRAGESHPALLAAALLHDSGKSLYPLSLLERVVIVLAKALLPERAKRWGSVPADDRLMQSWRRPFIVAEQHPAWGAEMAERAGASPLTSALIRRHQEKGSTESASPARDASSLENENRFLRVLQSADDES